MTGSKHLVKNFWITNFKNVKARSRGEDIKVFRVSRSKLAFLVFSFSSSYIFKLRDDACISGRVGEGEK